MSTPVMSLFEALVLGVVEGITEYLPISSTGHLILASEFLGLEQRVAGNPEALRAIQAFEIVIQSGAILAVLALYRTRLSEMISGLRGKNPSGLKLLRNIISAFIPTALIGLLLKGVVAQYLQHTKPVVIGLALGGVAMIAFGRHSLKRGSSGLSLYELSWQQAILIGLGQALALWPGMSRSMVTIMGGMVLGLSAGAATEFSFLLGLPTLLAATGFKAIKDGPVLMSYIGLEAMGCGLIAAAFFAAITVKWMIKHLNQLGLIWFGVYRLLIAMIMLSYFAAA